MEKKESKSRVWVICTLTPEVYLSILLDQEPFRNQTSASLTYWLNATEL